MERRGKQRTGSNVDATWRPTPPCHVDPVLHPGSPGRRETVALLTSKYRRESLD